MTPEELGQRLVASEEACMVADANPSFVSFVDRDYIYRFVNRAYEERTSKTRDEIVGRHVEELWGEALFVQLKHNLDRALAGEKFSTEYHDRDLGGVTGYVPYRVDGEVVGVWVFSQDTRELQFLRHASVHSEKMASLGKLVAAVLHGLNTPMAALRGTLETLTKAVDKLAEPDADRSAAAVARLARIAAPGIAAVDRTSAVLEDLKALVRLDQADVQVVDLNTCLTSALALMEAVLGSGFRIEKSFGDVPPLACRAAELMQVLLALLQFAASERDDDTAIRLTTRDGGEHVVVEIGYADADLDERTRANLMQPLLRGDGESPGADMTLVMCRDILAMTGGELELTGDATTGGSIRVSLPVKG